MVVLLGGFDQCVCALDIYFVPIDVQRTHCPGSIFILLIEGYKLCVANRETRKFVANRCRKEINHANVPGTGYPKDNINGHTGIW